MRSDEAWRIATKTTSVSWIVAATRGTMGVSTPKPRWPLRGHLKLIFCFLEFSKLQMSATGNLPFSNRERKFKLFEIPICRNLSASNLPFASLARERNRFSTFCWKPQKMRKSTHIRGCHRRLNNFVNFHLQYLAKAGYLQSRHSLDVALFKKPIELTVTRYFYGSYHRNLLRGTKLERTIIWMWYLKSWP